MAEYKFEAVGMFARMDALLPLVRKKSDYWELSDADLMAQQENGARVYAYSPRHLDCELVPEPDNPHDPNAIKVMLDGRHVGYVPAEECADVRPLLVRAEKIRAHIFCGPSKVISGDIVRHYDDELQIRVTITYSGAPVSSIRSPAVRSGKANRSVILQWIAAGLLLIFGLSTFPSFAPVFFILAAVLAAPISPLRDLLAARGIRGWMIAAAAVVFTVLGFVVYPGR